MGIQVQSQRVLVMWFGSKMPYKICLLDESLSKDEVAGASLTLREVGRFGDTGPESESNRQLVGSITTYKT